VSEVEAVEAANTAMYEAFESADVDRMARVWDDADPAAVVCVHPGWPMLRGRDHVLRSWSAVMAGTDYIQFFLTDVQVCVLGDTAVVTCTENVLTEVDESDPRAGRRRRRTNVLVRRPDGMAGAGAPRLAGLGAWRRRERRRIMLSGCGSAGFHGVLAQERVDGPGDFLVVVVLTPRPGPAPPRATTWPAPSTTRAGRAAAGGRAGEPSRPHRGARRRLAAVCLVVRRRERPRWTCIQAHGADPSTSADVSVTLVRQ
jgi:ketosteroid isomerase-like protein